MDSDATPAYRDMSRLTNLARGGLVLLLLASVVLFANVAVELGLLRDAQSGDYTSWAALERAIDASDNRMRISAIVMICIWLAAGVVNLTWIHRANANARALGAQLMTFTPGWSVGWYFVPVANLWKPYQAMKQIWAASQDPQNWPDQRIPGLLPLWWTLWIVSGITGRISWKLNSTAETIEDMAAADTFDLVTAPIDLILIIVFLTMISRIHAMQAAARQRPVPATVAA